MNPYKAPRPDEFNALFFQKHWDIIGYDVCAAVLSVLEGHASPSMMNHTFPALIPKKLSPTLITEFRPISLCNVVYKLVTKVLSNRLKPWLPAIISPNQSAFTPGRLISDNILIAYEAFHAMHRDPRVGGAMTLKLDMAKAYDRVEWEFLHGVMLRMGFRRPWIETVMRCVSSATFSVLINGAPSGHITQARGFAKGILYPLTCSSFVQRVSLACCDGL